MPKGTFFGADFHFSIRSSHWKFSRETKDLVLGDKGVQPIPQVYVADNCYSALVFKYRDLVFIGLLKPDTVSSMDDIKNLELLLKPTVSRLDSSFHSQEVTAKFQYIYYNQLNHALITSKTLPSDIDQVLFEVQHIHEQSEMETNEVFIKPSVGDRWVVGKFNAERQLYVVFDKKDASLLDAEDEVKRVRKEYFHHIFL